MKRRLNYITQDGWWDTDIDAIKQLKSLYDIHVIVVSSYKNNKFPKKEIEGVKIKDFKMRFSNKNPLSLFQNLFLISWLLIFRLKKNSINYYVISNNPLQQAFMYLTYPKSRTIIAVHNYLPHVDERGKITSLQPKFYNAFFYFHFYSKQQYELFLSDHSEEHHAFFTPMPLKDFGASKNKFKIEKGGKRVFTLFGNIRGYKRPDLFIQAANIINDPNSIFLVIGSCEQKRWDQYKSLIKTDTLFADIRYIDNEEIPDIFLKTDYLVLPYDDATQSGPLMIAVNYGVPIIASRQPIFESLIEGNGNGFLFEKGSLEDFISIIKKAIAVNQEEYNQMRLAQLLFKEKYKKETNIALRFTEFLELHGI